MSDRRLTFAVTSCGRLDLLRITISSFLRVNKYPIDRFVVIDDSGDKGVAEALDFEYGDLFDVIVNTARMGQMYSIDALYSDIDTPFIFHCEDDWAFENPSGADFIRDSIDVLLSDSSISQVDVAPLFLLERFLFRKRMRTPPTFRIITTAPLG